MSILEMLAPSRSVRLSAYDSARIGTGPGVYVIRCLDMGIPKQFNRLNGVDEEGILLIGEASNLSVRIHEFFRDIQLQDQRRHYHSEGWNWRYYFRDNSKPRAIRLPIEDMEVFWKTTVDEPTADRLETQLLQEYVLTFQDKPLLNISIKRQREV